MALTFLLSSKSAKMNQARALLSHHGGDGDDDVDDDDNDADGDNYDSRWLWQ